MLETLVFVLNSLLFGVVLAMDAFSVSIANGLNEPGMKTSKRFLIAGTYAFFQIVMPLLGWFFVHTIQEIFEEAAPYIPWVALALLVYLGVKMIVDTVRDNKTAAASDEMRPTGKTLTVGTLLLQGVATSIDALSVGFTIGDYQWDMALIECIIIGLVTLVICLLGLFLGRKIGSRFKNAGIAGGIILILIGIEIVLKALIGF